MSPGFQTIPREITYDARLEQLVYSPIRELARLRGETTSSASNAALRKPTQADKGLKLAAAPASELVLTFARPVADTRLTVELAAGTVYIDYVHGSEEHAVGYVLKGAGDARERGNDSIKDNEIQADFKEQEDDGDYGRRLRDPRQCNADFLHNNCTYADRLRLLPEEDTIRLRLFQDTVVTNRPPWAVLEAYFQDGRVVLTLPVPMGAPHDAVAEASAADWSAFVAADPAGKLANATAHGMGSVHVTADQVLEQLRRGR